ncbi:ADP-heptose--LPS heptosyltransferase [Stutzerimonas sp. VN223-3]
MSFAGKRVVIVPCPALGDVTVYLRLAWIFHCNGAHVSFFSSLLASAQNFFPWLHLAPDAGLRLQQLASDHDLVVSYVNWLHRTGEVVADVIAKPNIAYVTAKKLPSELGLDGREVRVADTFFPGASRPICLQSRSGWNMVQWVDQYAQTVFGLVCKEPIHVAISKPPCGASVKRVSIFPTTPEPKKNYSLSGFARLAIRLSRQGWEVDFICVPGEHEAIQASVGSFPVRSFSSIKLLMDHLATCKAVISNDSGGGHLGSLMGLHTFTITRKHAEFVWRPGFNPHNKVVRPLFSLKVMGRYVWRPFVPVRRIPAALAMLKVSS